MLHQASPLTPQRLHAELLETSVSGARAYLHGAAHDATISIRHRTVRFGQSDERWLMVLKLLIARLGRRAWIQFVQKNHGDLAELRAILEAEGIRCGRLHNPSRLRDPDLWRFYVGAADHGAFSRLVSSWHPRKRSLLEARFG